MSYRMGKDIFRRKMFLNCEFLLCYPESICHCLQENQSFSIYDVCSETVVALRAGKRVVTSAERMVEKQEAGMCYSKKKGIGNWLCFIYQ